MTRFFILTLCLCCSLLALCQDDPSDRRGLLMNQCSFESSADVMVLTDRGELSVNNDYSLRLDRTITIKFFREHKLDNKISDLIFYPSASFAKYAKLSVATIDIDQTTKSAVIREQHISSTHLDQSTIRIRRGMLLKVSYSISFPYEEKIPDWRFQSVYPTDQSSLKLSIPDALTLRSTMEGGYTPDISDTREASRQVHLNSELQPTKVREGEYRFNQLPSHRNESFSGNSPADFQRLTFAMQTVTASGMTKKDISARQVDKIIEQLSIHPDFLPRLSGELVIKSDFDRRIRAITSPEEKLARIYDLVRRHLTWDRVDTLSAHPLAKVWLDKKGNSTEINLILVKLLEEYGFEASPLIVSTRSNGKIDTNAVALTDFDRTVAHVRIGGRTVILDATAKYYDYPMLSPALLNSYGLLISMDLHRWVYVADNKTYYRNNVILLGNLTGDSSFLTNVYVNSAGYAKGEHVDIYERDSLRGIRDYFERGNKSLRLKHFIVANEYIDTLPLAQEFDIRIAPVKTDNLYGIAPTAFAIPDTLFTVTDDRKTPVNFGYRQQYDLISEFSFPERYEIYLMPNNVSMSSVNGNVHFEREYHNSTTNFSMKQTLLIDKSNFTLQESVELAKFLRKINNLQQQQVVLKRLN